MLTITKSITSKLSPMLPRFRKDDQGTSTIEFAIVAPFFLILMLGTASLSDAENVTTQVGKVSSSVADIISQSQTVNADFIDQTMLAGEALMGSRADNLELFVTGIEIVDTSSDPDNPNLEARVLWARGNDNIPDGGLPAKGSTYDLDPGLLVQGGFVVVAKASLTYEPLFGNLKSDTYFGYGNGEPHKYEYEHVYFPRVGSQLRTDCSNC